MHDNLSLLRVFTFNRYDTLNLNFLFKRPILSQLIKYNSDAPGLTEALTMYITTLSFFEAT